MAQITLYGPPQSSYVRTARMTCAQKGVSHELGTIEFGSEAHLALHPFGKVPALAHGDVNLFETQAILRYVDAAFDGPALVPTNPVAMATMEQWISVHNCYLYDHFVKQYAFSYIRPKGEGGQPDRAAIEAAMPNVERGIGMLDRALDGQPFLTGELSLADLLLAPIVTTLAPFPEGGQQLDRSSNVRRWLTALEQLPCGQFLHAPRG
ncbi:MAG: glutathione S-transferase family protein [Deltaproteobacteria bacterium]|nr:glutathione S-transferase family protein [Deltaproteobacteria bacterium]